MPYFRYNTSELEALEHALKIKKYSHLTSWKLLASFQVYCGDPVKFHEIATYAKRKNRGERITLPLKDCDLIKREANKTVGPQPQKDFIETVEEVFT